RRPPSPTAHAPRPGPVRSRSPRRGCSLSWRLPAVTGSIERLAYAVLLPAVAGLETAELVPLLDRGCRADLLGAARAEYLARAMSRGRAAGESPGLVRETVGTLRSHASEELLVAVDHEVVGIRRFEHLLRPDTPAEALRDLGVNVALGPIVDVVRGE